MFVVIANAKPIKSDKWWQIQFRYSRTAPVDMCDVWWLNFCVSLFFRSRGCGLADCRLPQLTALFCYSNVDLIFFVTNQPEKQRTIFLESRTCLLHLIKPVIGVMILVFLKFISSAWEMDMNRFFCVPVLFFSNFNFWAFGMRKHEKE